MAVAVVLVALPFALFAYAYLIYPAALWLLSRARRPPASLGDPAEWPLVTITVPAYNEAARIRATIESLLDLDYPSDRRQIVIASDASTDGTDDIVREFADRGVELVRAPVRGGKTNTEQVAAAAFRGSIVLNTDASIRVHRHALKALVRAFGDPTVGVASGRDVSVGDEARESNRGESGYVGYEMWVRSLETRLGTIVGASGCCYAAKVEVQRTPLPSDLARDFASVMIARTMGLRAVSVDAATCVVPRALSLRVELRRKVRTMAQGLETLFHFRGLMNPVEAGGFALMLFSHKLARWLGYLALPLALIGLALAAFASVPARVAAGAVVIGVVVGVVALRWSEERRAPLPITLAGFALASSVAGVLAWVKVLRRQRMPIWEPTRRQVGRG